MGGRPKTAEEKRIAAIRGKQLRKINIFKGRDDLRGMYEEDMINANVEGYERQVLILPFFFCAPEDGHVLPTPETIHAILKERHDL
jgi:hypothetical protein